MEADCLPLAKKKKKKRSNQLKKNKNEMKKYIGNPYPRGQPHFALYKYMYLRGYNWEKGRGLAGWEGEG